MENWIERACEPRELFLAWQAPDLSGDRFRWAVGLLTRHESGCRLRYFAGGEEFAKFNQGKNFDDLLHAGYTGYPAFKLRPLVHNENVLATLMRRLPPRSRSDFDQYRRGFRLSEKLSLSDFALLGYTEAKLPSDGFSVVDRLSPEADDCDLMIEIAGYRHYAAKRPARPGEPVALVPEPTNKYDKNAVMVCAGDECIGYINRLQTETFLRWLPTRDVSGFVERLNGSADRPSAYIFVRVRGRQTRAAA